VEVRQTGAGLSTAIRLRAGADLPEPFNAIAKERNTKLVYIGKAQEQTSARPAR
jgi:hypothetical protein